MPPRYDALLLVSFGGPERKEDVMPFLERVLRGRDVPPERLREVAGHYDHFGGRSPINDQCRALLAALDAELARDGPRLPSTGATATGSRSWPTRYAGWPATASRALSHSSPRRSARTSGCRQYLEDIARARAEIGAGAPEVDKLRGFHNHPGFVEPLVESVAAALELRSGGAGRHAGSSSRRTASRSRWRPALPTRHSCARRAASSRRRWGDPATRSSTRAAADRPASPGSSRTSGTSCSRSRRRRERRGRWPRSASSPTTWRWSTTSTSRRAVARASSVSRWSGPRP